MLNNQIILDVIIKGAILSKSGGGLEIGNNKRINSDYPLHKRATSITNSFTQEVSGNYASLIHYFSADEQLYIFALIQGEYIGKTATRVYTLSAFYFISESEMDKAEWDIPSIVISLPEFEKWEDLKTGKLDDTLQLKHFNLISGEKERINAIQKALIHSLLNNKQLVINLDFLGKPDQEEFKENRMLKNRNVQILFQSIGTLPLFLRKLVGFGINIDENYTRQLGQLHLIAIPGINPVFEDRGKFDLYDFNQLSGGLSFDTDTEALYQKFRSLSKIDEEKVTRLRNVIFKDDSKRTIDQSRINSIIQCFDILQLLLTNLDDDITKQLFKAHETSIIKLYNSKDPEFFLNSARLLLKCSQGENQRKILSQLKNPKDFPSPHQRIIKEQMATIIEEAVEIQINALTGNKGFVVISELENTIKEIQEFQQEIPDSLIEKYKPDKLTYNAYLDQLVSLKRISEKVTIKQASDLRGRISNALDHSILKAEDKLDIARSDKALFMDLEFTREDLLFLLSNLTLNEVHGLKVDEIAERDISKNKFTPKDVPFLRALYPYLNAAEKKKIFFALIDPSQLSRCYGTNEERFEIPTEFANFILSHLDEPLEGNKKLWEVILDKALEVVLPDFRFVLKISSRYLMELKQWYNYGERFETYLLKVYSATKSIMEKVSLAENEYYCKNYILYNLARKIQIDPLDSQILYFMENNLWKEIDNISEWDRLLAIIQKLDLISDTSLRKAFQKKIEHKLKLLKHAPVAEPAQPEKSAQFAPPHSVDIQIKKIKTSLRMVSTVLSSIIVILIIILTISDLMYNTYMSDLVSYIYKINRRYNELIFSPFKKQHPTIVPSVKIERKPTNEETKKVKADLILLKFIQSNGQPDTLMVNFQPKSPYTVIDTLGLILKNNQNLEDITIEKQGKENATFNFKDKRKLFEKLYEFCSKEKVKKEDLMTMGFKKSNNDSIDYFLTDQDIMHVFDNIDKKNPKQVFFLIKKHISTGEIFKYSGTFNTDVKTIDLFLSILSFISQ